MSKRAPAKGAIWKAVRLDHDSDSDSEEEVKKKPKTKNKEVEGKQEEDVEMSDEETPERKKAAETAKELTKRAPKGTEEDKSHHFAKGQITKDTIWQADLITVSDDGGYKYILSICDVGTREVAAKPLKSKEPSEVLDRFKEVVREMGKPSSLQVDGGGEFKTVFKDYCDENNIYIRISQPYRHSQQSIIESCNRIIVRRLYLIQGVDEIVTSKVSKKWVSRLPKVIAKINEERSKYKNEDPIDPDDKPVGTALGKYVLPEGTKVRVLLDHPEDFNGNKRNTAQFREGDRRWSDICHINRVIIVAGEPVRYMVDLEGKDNVSYSRTQIQVLDKIKKPTKKEEKDND